MISMPDITPKMNFVQVHLKLEMTYTTISSNNSKIRDNQESLLLYNRETLDIIFMMKDPVLELLFNYQRILIVG